MTSSLADPELNAALRVAITTGDLPRHKRQAALAELDAALHPTNVPSIAWSSPRPGVYFIDNQRVDCALHAMTAAFLAVAAPGRALVRAADHCAPGVEHPDDSIRAGLRRAAAFIEPYSRGLATVIAALRVEDGFVRHHPNRHVNVVTS